MDELYRLIEEKIKRSGFPGEIDGHEFYNEVSNEVGEKENGAYIFMIKKSENLYYEGHMDVLDQEFDLHTVDIHVGDVVYHVDFDA